MDVSIIILNYKTKRLVRQQLLHWRKQTAGFSHEIIVVDNASQDGIGPMLKEDFPEVLFVPQERNAGYAAGNNAGIAVASGRYVLIANPDIVLNASAIGQMLSFMNQSPRVGMAGPKLVNADNSLQFSCFRFPDIWLPLYRRTFFAATPWGRRWLDKYCLADWDHADARPVDWLLGACVIVRKSALISVGLLDEKFFLYLEDTDWCRRFWLNHYEVFYLPQAELVHLHRRSSEGSIFSIVVNQPTRIHIRSFLHYLAKYRGQPNPHIT